MPQMPERLPSWGEFRDGLLARVKDPVRTQTYEGVAVDAAKDVLRELSKMFEHMPASDEQEKRDAEFNARRVSSAIGQLTRMRNV